MKNMSFCAGHFATVRLMYMKIRGCITEHFVQTVRRRKHFLERALDKMKVFDCMWWKIDKEFLA